jgi:DNA modification methylase
MEINKVYQGDWKVVLAGIPEHTFDLSIIDPPYNVGIDEWDKIEEYKSFSEEWIKEVVRITKPNKAIWVFGNQHSINIMKNILDSIPVVRFRSWIVWNKGVGIPNPNNFSNLYEQILYYIKVPDSKVLSDFGKYIKKRREELNLSLKEIGELCGEIWYHRGGHLYFETGLVRPTVEQYLKLKEVLKLDDTFDIWLNCNFTFNLESVGVKWKYEKDKRNKRGWKNCGDVWNIPQLSGTFKERLDHPCQKPIKLIDRIIKVSSNKGDLVLDLFAGTGTTSLVSQRLERNFIANEKDDRYVALINKRLNQKNIHHFQTTIE